MSFNLCLSRGELISHFAFERVSEENEMPKVEQEKEEQSSRESEKEKPFLHSEAK
jgi:hypothetical protein